ncbi:integrase [Cohnella lubricantis]|uniref:Integrase n=1 Tax=Cohnella lubricantis TaxID=2163172 RepID=A0A841TGC3_9BACL|nr:integrase [Cohnella lubricantis]MBB6677997.1 integrase [Cohnella lubricantis]MBP2120541.1 integrase [Cohnella lubricantis]
MDSNLFETWKEEYLSQDDTYCNHVNKFVKYITQIGKADHPIRINKEDIVECVGYYHGLKEINTISTMENHLESVKAFYKYLFSTHKTNNIFNEIPSYQEFKESIIERYHLQVKRNRGYWEDSELIDIVKALDNYFDLNDISDLSGIYPKKLYYKFLILRLFIKLTLIAPAKKSVICSLRIEKFTEDYRTLNINDTRINIPNGLRRDIIFSISIGEKHRNRKVTKEDNLFEFIYNDNFRVVSLNQYFYAFLKHTRILEIPSDTDSFPVEVIMDSALFELVRNGTNPALIAKINGQTLATIESKFYNNGIPITDADSLINHEISKTAFHKYL